MLDLKNIDINYIVEKTITTQMDDTWDLLSFIIYADESYTDQFIYANKYNNINVFIESDIKINIPKIDNLTHKKRNKAPWK